MATLNWKTPNGTTGSLDLSTVVTSVATGTTNGTISVNGTNVAVKGLGSAAYTASTAYAASSHTHSYLPLSGGTMSGTINFSASEGRIQSSRSDNDGYVSVYGGAGYTTGGYACYYGKNHTSYPGEFRLIATDGTTTNALIGKPDGTLTWDNNNVIVEKGGHYTQSTIDSITESCFFTGANELNTNPPQLAGTDYNGIHLHDSVYDEQCAEIIISGNQDMYFRVKDTKPTASYEWSDLRKLLITSDITTGSSNGRISVNGTDVAVRGLGSAAYTASSDYLKLSGGTMTGAIRSSASDLVLNKTNTNGRTIIRAGTDYNNCASLYLSGKDHNDGAIFQLLCNDGTNNSTLIGKSDGTLTWGGKNVICQKNLSGGSSGYIVFTNSLAFVWGVANYNSAKYVDCTLPISLSHVYKAYGADCVSESATQLNNANGTICWASANNTTSGGLITKIRFVSDVSNIAVFQYFVIGNIT